MTAPTDTRATLHKMIDEMSQEALADLLDYLNLLSDPDELTPEEEAQVRQAMAELERGETIDGETLRRELGIEI